MALIKFVRNHKKKLIFIILVFGGSYWAIKRWMNLLKEASILFSPKTALLAERQLKIRKKTDHYLTIKKTSDEAIIELTKTLQDRLNKKFCTEEILESLKQKPPNKLELWENLKIACLSKCMASIYSICALSVLIKIHLNIVGACLFINNISFDYFVTQSKCDQSIDLSPNVQKKYLENIENYVNDGVTKISSYVEEVNNEIFKSLSLKDNLTMDNVIEMFESFKKRFKQDSNHLISTSIKVDRNVNKTITVDLDAIDTIKLENQVSKTDEDILNEINMDTLDIVTSCDFNNVFDSLVDFLSNEFINKLTTLMVQQVVRQESSRSDNFTIALPLAKLIPLMDKSHQMIQSDHHIRSSFLDDLKLNLFSENIYEAFSYIESGEDDQTDLSANQIASLTEAIKLFK